MKVCDRHPDRKNRTTLRDLIDGSEVDLCTECREEFAQWVGGKALEPAAAQPPKRGRPKK